MATASKIKNKKSNELKKSLDKSTIKGKENKNTPENKKVILKTSSVNIKKEKSLNKPLEVVKKTTKKVIDKTEEIKISDTDLLTYSIDDLLTLSYGKKGTKERDSAELRIKEYEISLINGLKLKPEIKNEVEDDLSVRNPIVPIVDLEKSLDENKTPRENRAIDTQKIFSIMKGFEFLKGDIKVTVDYTNIIRLNELDFSIYGHIGTPNAFSILFKALDLNDAENFVDELTDYEINPDKYTTLITDMENTENATDNSAENELKPIVPIGEDKKEAIIKKFEGLPLNEVNIAELIEAAPSSTIEPVVNKSLGQAANVSQIVNKQIISQMESYGESVLSAINERPWNPKSQTDINRLISNQVSREYTYLLKNDGKGFYVEMAKNEILVRIPKDINAYLNVS